MNKSCLYGTLITVIFLVWALASCSAYTAHPDFCRVEEPLCKLDDMPSSDSKPLNIDDSTTVYVFGCNPLNNSGVSVQKNQQYEIKLMETSDWKDGDVVSDPVEGWEGSYNHFKGWLLQSCKRSDQTNWYAVTGSIGKDDDCTFPVLSKSPKNTVITIPRSGMLYFFANDMKGRYFNNHGYVVLEIKRVQDAPEGTSQIICKEADEQ